MDATQELLDVAWAMLKKAKMAKRAYLPPDGAGAPPGGAAGAPMDPSMAGGGAPPPMDPAMAGGAPPMDPSMAGGAPPPADPAMAGDPMAGAPPQAGAGGLPPDVIQQIAQAVMQQMQGGAPGGMPGAPGMAGKGGDKMTGSMFTAATEAQNVKLDNILVALKGVLDGQGKQLPTDMLLAGTDKMPGGQETGNMPQDMGGSGNSAGGGGASGSQIKTSSAEEDFLAWVNVTDKLFTP